MNESFFCLRKRFVLKYILLFAKNVFIYSNFTEIYSFKAELNNLYINNIIIKHITLTIVFNKKKSDNKKKTNIVVNT